MVVRRLGQVALASAAMMLPRAVMAQAEGLVTVGPLIAGAPVLGIAGLGALALALAIGAAVMLRRSHPRTTAALVLLAVSAISAVAYASTVHLIVSGDECGQVTQKSFSPLVSVVLESQCPNPIRIVDLEIDCTDVEHGEEALTPPIQPCEVGLNLAPGETCALPSCPC